MGEQAKTAAGAKPGVKKKIAGVARTRWDDDDY